MAIENCPQCNAPRDSADLKFCTNCGKPLADSSSPGPEQSSPQAFDTRGQTGQHPDEVQNTQVLPQWDQPQQQWAGSGQPQQGQWGAPVQHPHGQQPPSQQWGAPQPGGPNGPNGPGQPWQQAGGNGGNNGRDNGAKIALIVGLVVLLLAAVGITLALVLGGDDKASDAPDNASKEEFCEATKRISGLGDDDWSKASDVADDVAKVGTPQGMPEDARKGFETAIDILRDAKDEDDADGKVEALPEDGEANLQAFSLYLIKNCGTGGSDSPTSPSDIPSAQSEPSDFPSDLLTEFPTELPSGFPTDLLSELLEELPSGFPTESLTDFPSDFGEN